MNLKHLYIIIIIIAALGCHDRASQPTPKNNRKDTLSTLEDANKTFPVYQFDDRALVNGCAKVALQKISRDNRYELLINIDFDSIPKYSEMMLDSTYNISLNRYPKGNTFINNICDDVHRIGYDYKAPEVFKIVRGKFVIKTPSGNSAPFKISAVISRLLLRNEKGEMLLFPEESFKDVLIGWFPG